MSKLKPHTLLLAVSVALYFVSLSLPALLFAEHEPLSGLYVLSWGWWGLLTFDPAWFANPAFVATVILIGLRRYSVAVMSGTLAVLLGATSFFAAKWWFHEGYGTPITALGSGFYVWWIGLAIALLSAFLAWRTDTGKPLD